MKKIKWLKPNKAQQKIMDAERKSICKLTALKKKRKLSSHRFT